MTQILAALQQKRALATRKIAWPQCGTARTFAYHWWMLPFVTKSFQELCPGDFIHFDGVSLGPEDLLLVDKVVAAKHLPAAYVATVFDLRGGLIYLTAPDVVRVSVLASKDDPPGWAKWDLPSSSETQWVLSNL